MHQRGPGRPCAGHGRERPVARGQPEVVQRDVLARGEKGRDRTPRDAAAQTGRGRARAERRVVEGFGREVHDYVSGDGVDSAGRDDDPARFCREVVEPEVFSGSGGKCCKRCNWQNGKTKRGRFSLFDHVENPWGFPGDVDVMHAVPCACAGGYRR